MIRLRLYPDYLIEEDEIIGIFDLDSATEAFPTRKFLREAEAKGLVRVASKNIPRSFVLTQNAVYLSHSTKGALLKSLSEY